ncbi:Extracellular ligand-binding receptor [Sterolibacterium denitrificans]|uniref:Extracellular ligand-binding receptor n=1 Tax=Sterolibacterium denitrificans TaxID=157592 RepID=A0A7Z7MUK1_9PROT|nr:branched-chain amino acid ABC transporter substrate-binding protein [Sterolibacterium denitrificans]SMB23329.1 Extracellular ligand-binding receptor [Sterolibacterium denitrificans]
MKPTVPHRARTLPLMAALSAILCLAACGKPAAPTPASGATADGATIIRIGQVSPLTGGSAHLGKDNENGVRLAIEEANARGVEIGGRKVHFELLSEDDQSDPKIGTTVAQKLIDAGIAGVVGHLNSGTTIPASALYEQAGIPMISGSSTNPQLTEQSFRHVFRIVGRDDQQGPAVANYLLAEIKPKTVAVIDDATAYGAGLANEVEKTLKAAGVQVLPREQGTNKTADWKAILTKLKGKKPDAVFYGGMDDTAGPLLKQARELGLNQPFSFGDGGCTDKMLELAGAAVEGMYCSQAGIPVRAASQPFLDAYQARFAGEPLLYGPFTYDAANLLIAAMQQAGSSDPAQYLPALAQIRHDGATGHIEFDAKGDRKDAEITIFTARSGRIVPLTIVKSGALIGYEAFIARSRGQEAAAER